MCFVSMVAVAWGQVVNIQILRGEVTKLQINFVYSSCENAAMG
jgi:hypothetical protein